MPSVLDLNVQRSLLGRDLVETQLDSIKKYISGLVILITGAAGSIGSQLCRQILNCDPSILICIDQDERAMFGLQSDLRDYKGPTNVFFCLGNICDQNRMRRIFVQYQPQVVFHCAAYKHLVMLETNVEVAVENNVFGLINMLDIARDTECHSFVLISSDKAVNPTSIMGATKRIGELVLGAQPDNRLRCITVRFGNVLSSSGSVVPIIQEQIRKGGPVTITHPDASRFFMTLDEAGSLVLQALAIGLHGDTLILDMGNPVRIVELARTLIRLAGKTEQQVKIIFTGLRNGEKLSEELFYPMDSLQSTSSPKIKKSFNISESRSDLSILLEDLRFLLHDGTPELIKAKIKEIVPEYSCPSRSDMLVQEDSKKLAIA